MNSSPKARTPVFKRLDVSEVEAKKNTGAVTATGRYDQFVTVKPDGICHPSCALRLGKADSRDTARLPDPLPLLWFLPDTALARSYALTLLMNLHDRLAQHTCRKW